VAAVLASSLAARDDYGVAAAAYGGGAVLGLVLFAALESSEGIVSLAWGVAANGAFTVALPLGVLAARGWLGGESARLRLGSRLGALIVGAAVPIALQAMYVVSLS